MWWVLEVVLKCPLGIERKERHEERQEEREGSGEKVGRRKRMEVEEKEEG